MLYSFGKQFGANFLQCRPVFLLRDDDGTLAGAVFASRTALYAIRSGVIVDASRTGIVARLAGLPIKQVNAPKNRQLVVIGTEPSIDTPFSWESADTLIPVRDGNRETLFTAFKIQLDLAGTEPKSPWGDPSPDHRQLLHRLTADHWGRAKAHYPGMWHSADSWIVDFGERISVESISEVNDPQHLPERALSFCDKRL